MIEFSLQVEARIIRAVLPELGKLFALSVKEEDYSDHFPDIDDPDFKEAWIEGLKQEAKDDRNALARLLKSPRLKYGRVEVKEDEVEDLLRGLTEIRFTIRKTSLKKLSDEELETGIADIPTKNPEVQIGFFAYLLMAEVQERLIQEIS
jgi:hypothetical protein